MVQIKEIRNKLKNYTKNKGKFVYVDAFRNKKIKKKHFVLESTHGDSVGGHNYYLIKEIKNKVKRAKIFVVAKNVEKAKRFFEVKGIEDVQIVEHLSVEYYELLATSEYLINDTTFYPFFNKKKGQKYYIIWHGTPLKYMGKDMPVVVDVSNVQRNFYMADKIFVSNEYTKDILSEAYNLKNVYQGKIVVSPSPRNSIFLNDIEKNKIKENLNIENKKILCYMPTWRGTVGKVKKTSHTQELLNYLEKTLAHDTLLYVKLHDFEKNNISFDKYSKIKEFPGSYETYEFLSITDGLITDYSSVMYDYANMNKPVILYTYDYEEYIESRGVYEDIDKYPFKRIENLEDLIIAIDNLSIEDYSIINERFTYSDCIDGAERVIKNIL
ncbi:glycosyl transferase family 1, partial [Staphylococcus piscifermentans]